MLLALVACLTRASVAQDPLRHPPSHPDRGLPMPGSKWAPYHSDPEHVLNRVFRECYLVLCVPAEVGAALPREHGSDAEFLVPEWYFQKRKGAEADARWFGGDGRQLPRESFTPEESAKLLDDLGRVDGEVAAALRANPRLAVWFQHDLLRMARRLLDTEKNPELLSPLLAAARRVALPASALASGALGTFQLADLKTVRPNFDPARCTEIERRSSQLFDAEFTQLWSSIHVTLPPAAEPDLAAWLALAKAQPKEPPPLPVGALAVLVQGIVALDNHGTPRATDLVVEVRTQELANRDPLSAGNRTTTRDGIDFAIWSLQRQTLRERAERLSFADFRRIDLEDQELFRDYGTRKHTTIAAQCALCHRRTNSPDEALGGFSALRPTSAPRPVTDAGERRRLAEAEMAKFVAELERSSAQGASAR